MVVPAIWIDDVEFDIRGENVRLVAHSESMGIPCRLSREHARTLVVRLISVLDEADMRDDEGADIMPLRHAAIPSQ